MEFLWRFTIPCRREKWLAKLSYPLSPIPILKELSFSLLPSHPNLLSFLVSFIHPIRGIRFFELAVLLAQKWETRIAEKCLWAGRSTPGGSTGQEKEVRRELVGWEESARGPPFFDIKRVTRVTVRGEIESERRDGALTDPKVDRKKGRREETRHSWHPRRERKGRSAMLISLL